MILLKKTDVSVCELDFMKLMLKSTDAALDAGKKHKKTRKRKATLMKFARKKSKSKKVTPPAPDDDGEYQVMAIIFFQHPSHLLFDIPRLKRLLDTRRKRARCFIAFVGSDIRRIKILG